uniref:Uncharacterized protein n=1 Tax=Micrurus carvalhoi TaxID=3147026 RepID=A0A2H6MXH0_9SAUR
MLKSKCCFKYYQKSLNLILSKLEMRHELSVDINYIRICRIGTATDPCLICHTANPQASNFYRSFLNQNTLYVHTIKSVFFPIFTRHWHRIKVSTYKSIHLLLCQVTKV